MQGAQSGVVLLTVLMSVAALAVLGGTIAVLSSIDIKTTGFFKRSVDAYYQAEAGVHYVRTRIEADLKTNGLALSAPVETVTYTAPATMQFGDVTQLLRTSDTNSYYYEVTGTSLTSRCKVGVVFRRRSAFEMGLFGDKEIEMKAYGNVYSYYSDEITTPGPSDSTGEAYIGSNEEVLTGQDTLIDGSFQVGEDTSGAQGIWKETPPGGSIIEGDAALPADRVDPDPLGALSGDLANDFAYYSLATNNNNDSASPPITSPQYKIALNNGVSMTLSAGNYYVADINLKNGATLNIDSTSGPVTIYLTGAMEAKEGSSINFTGNPPDFRIFSNSTDSIILKNGGDFKGVIYAPYADVHILNSGDLYGLIWAGEIEVKNSGSLYIDLSAMQGFPSSSIVFLSWKEIR
ncbi:MAG: hypothetical protein O2973_10765 [Gemmatimonadetes bacterium]|nr:hypothetical protein [Gemmatimonadota bacterium]